MPLSTISTLAGNKSRVKTEEYTDLTYTFTGTNYTNNGITPFDLNIGTLNTTCRINNITQAEFASSSGFTFWMRYKLNTASFKRLYTFTTVANGLGSKKSYSFISYNGNTYTQYVVNMTANSVGYSNAITTSIITAANTYNVFVTTSTQTGSFVISTYIHEMSGTMIYSLVVTVPMATYNAAPIDDFYLFRDGAFDGSVAAGTIHKAAKFNKVISSTERTQYSSLAL